MGRLRGSPLRVLLWGDDQLLRGYRLVYNVGVLGHGVVLVATFFRTVRGFFRQRVTQSSYYHGGSPVMPILPNRYEVGISVLTIRVGSMVLRRFVHLRDVLITMHRITNVRHGFRAQGVLRGPRRLVRSYGQLCQAIGVLRHRGSILFFSVDGRFFWYLRRIPRQDVFERMKVDLLFQHEGYIRYDQFIFQRLTQGGRRLKRTRLFYRISLFFSLHYVQIVPGVVRHVTTTSLRVIFLRRLFSFFFILTGRHVSSLGPPGIPKYTFLRRFYRAFSKLLYTLWGILVGCHYFRFLLPAFFGFCLFSPLGPLPTTQ